MKLQCRFCEIFLNGFEQKRTHELKLHREEYLLARATELRAQAKELLKQADDYEQRAKEGK